MPLVINAGMPLEPQESLRHQAMERLVLLDEDEGTEGVVDRPLKRRWRQEVSTTVKVSSKEGA